jgi:hypothetical protein
MRRKDLKCPECGGPCNSYTPISVKGKIVLVCECWSGSLYGERGPDYKHIYTKTLRQKKSKVEDTSQMGSPYNQFVSKKYHEGITDFKEIGRLWREKKEELGGK